MTWKRAFEADARLAAKNAIKIRAALRQSINAQAIAEGYQQTQPQPVGNLAQQRARARAWAIMNVRVNLEPLKEALLRAVAEAYLLGIDYADEQVELARRRQKAPTTTINWATWKPGDRVAALLVKPPKAFQQLLSRYGLTLKGFSDTTLNDIGNSLGESLELGLSGKQTAKRLLQYVASPSRALSIAVTEQNRAISVATVARYKEMGVEKQEWIASDPCDECQENDGQVVAVGSPFNSGDTEPPVHPNCRCALLPVVLGGEGDTEAINDIVDISDDDTGASSTPSMAYESATESESYWTNDKLLQMYGVKSNGDIDYSSYNRNGENVFLKNILKTQGFNGKPRVVNAAEYEKFVNQGATPLFRGLAGNNSKDVIKYVENYLHGDTPFIGKGMFGDGTYFASTREVAEKFAKEDRTGNAIPFGQVIEGVLDPRAKVASAQDISDYISRNRTRLYDTPQDYYEDHSAVASTLGFDAIKITNPTVQFGANAQPVNADYYIVLNRTAMIMKGTT